MPIFESICESPTCWMAGCRQEHFYHTSETQMRECDSCGGPTVRQEYSVFRVVFTGAITARYNDRNSENPHQEGHWAYRKKSSLSGKPEKVFITDFQQQKEFCKAEGLANPREQPKNMIVAADGKRLESTAGLPGTEI